MDSKDKYYKVEFEDDTSQDIVIECTRENETEEVIFSTNDIDVVIDYFWDSHGNLIQCDGPNGNSRDEIHADTIKIVEHSYDLIMYNDKMSYTDWDLYINGEQIDADVYSYKRRKRFFIKAIVGWG